MDIVVLSQREKEKDLKISYKRAIDKSSSNKGECIKLAKGKVTMTTCRREEINVVYALLFHSLSLSRDFARREGKIQT